MSFHPPHFSLIEFSRPLKKSHWKEIGNSVSNYLISIPSGIEDQPDFVAIDNMGEQSFQGWIRGKSNLND